MTRRLKDGCFLAAVFALQVAAPFDACASPESGVVLGTLTYTSELQLRAAVAEMVEHFLAAKGLHVDSPSLLVDHIEDAQPGSTVTVQAPLALASDSSPRMPLRIKLAGTAKAGEARAWDGRLLGRLMRNTLTLAHPVAKGAPVTCSDMVIQPREATFKTDTLLPLPCSIAPGTVLRRSLAAGDSARTSDLGLKPVVAETEPVVIRVVVGNVVLESDGLAMSDADLGQQVKVRPNTSRQVLLARVVGPHTVQVDAGSAE